MDYTNILPELFPFKNLEHETILSVSIDIKGQIKNFDKDSVIISPDRDSGKILGFVLRGECSAEISHSGGEVTTLNTLGVHDSFGILTIFAPEKEFPTTVRATKSSKILLIDAEDFVSVVKKYPTVGVNVIAFLAERICFLNKRIATFCGRSAEEKLAHALSRASEDGRREIPFSGTKMASSLGMGRATLYRAVDSLESEGLIARTQKTIIINDPTGLERKIK